MINNFQLPTFVQTKVNRVSTPILYRQGLIASLLPTSNSQLLTSLNTAAVLPVVFDVPQQIHLSRD
ncbi:hypothetical protein NSTC731_02894 [Nostoc sp. DSM 114167]|jgi:hypothetical protein